MAVRDLLFSFAANTKELRLPERPFSLQTRCNLRKNNCHSERMRRASSEESAFSLSANTNTPDSPERPFYLATCTDVVCHPETSFIRWLYCRVPHPERFVRRVGTAIVRALLVYPEEPKGRARACPPGRVMQRIAGQADAPAPSTIVPARPCHPEPICAFCGWR